MWDCLYCIKTSLLCRLPSLSWLVGHGQWNGVNHPWRHGPYGSSTFFPVCLGSCLPVILSMFSTPVVCLSCAAFSTVVSQNVLGIASFYFPFGILPHLAVAVFTFPSTCQIYFLLLFGEIQTCNFFHIQMFLILKCQLDIQKFNCTLSAICCITCWL